MSLARMTKDSDVYVYVSDAKDNDRTALEWTCCGERFRDADKVIEHIKEHINSGDRVPDNVIPDIEDRRVI